RQERGVAELQGAQAVASRVRDEEHVAIARARGAGAGRRAELSEGRVRHRRVARHHGRACEQKDRAPGHWQLPSRARTAVAAGWVFETSIRATRHAPKTLTARQAESA